MRNSKNFVTQLSVLMVLAFATCAIADTRDEKIAKYIELSGIEKVIDSIPSQLDAVSSQRLMTSKTPDADKKAIELLKEAFDGQRARKELFNFVTKQIENDLLLQNLLKWYESPLAQKIDNEESSSSGADKQADLLQYLTVLQKNPPTRERIDIIQEVESTIQLSELTTNIVVEIMKGMFKTISLTVPKEKQVELADIEKEIIKLRPIMKEGLRKQMVLSSFYIYRNLSNAELREYIAFCKTETGKKEIEITGGALSYVLSQWFAVATDKILAHSETEAEKSKK
ncbi:MAG: hypothetical protein M0009_17590 [Deltaproteobacteria bacterium]|nr:hypothetical protein [Deltaproteobacteria bacterium]